MGSNPTRPITTVDDLRRGHSATLRGRRRQMALSLRASARLGGVSAYSGWVPALCGYRPAAAPGSVAAVPAALPEPRAAWRALRGSAGGAG